MRILVVHPHLDRFGGSERLTRILVYELASMGNELTVVTGGRSEYWFPDHANVRFRMIRHVSEAYNGESRFSRLVDVVMAMGPAIIEENPDVVLVMIQEPIYAVVSKIVNPQIPTAIYIHFPIEEELTSANLFRFISMYRFPNIYNDFFRVVDVHMVNSNYTASALYRLYGIEANVVYPAIEWDFFENEPDLDADRGRVIVSIGRFVPQKRFDSLISIFRRYVKPEIPDAKLVIIGVPDDRYEEYHKHVLEMADRAGDVEVISKVLSVEEMIGILREASVYVHMRRGEHFGMAPVEAMSQGVIPIIHGESGLAELISHGRDGFLAYSDEEFARYLIHVLRMGRDELRRMRRFAFRKSWYFNPDRFAREVLGALELARKARSHA